ncbi:hypothetical protein S245_022917, partial [Arachis hypogaea]
MSEIGCEQNLSKISYIPEDFDEDRTFYMQIDPVSILPEIPLIFYRKYKDQLNQRMFFIDLNQNQVEVMIGKGHSCAYILAGFDTLVKFYELKEGGWMKVMFIGEDLFLITKVKDSAMISKTLPSPPVKFLLDVKLSTLNVNDFSLSTNQINSVAKYVDIHSQSDVLPKLPDSVLRENYNSVVNPVSFDSLTSNSAHLGFHSQNNDVLFTDSSTILPHTIPNIGTDQIILSSNAPIHHNCLPYSVSNINVNSPLTVSFECTNPIARKIGGHGDISSTNEYIPVTANNSYYLIPLSTPMQLGSRSGIQFTPEFISCQKLLSDSQILPNVFAMNAFPSRPKTVAVRFGKFSPLRMGLRWNDSRKLQLFLTKGWKQFAKMHRFKEGTLLKFSVAIGDESVIKFKDLLGNTIVTFDANHNLIELRIEKLNHTAYIIRGLHKLMNFYGLYRGGYIKLSYAYKEYFRIIKIKDHNMVEKSSIYIGIKLLLSDNFYHKGKLPLIEEEHLCICSKRNSEIQKKVKSSAYYTRKVMLNSNTRTSSKIVFCDETSHDKRYNYKHFGSSSKYIPVDLNLAPEVEEGSAIVLRSDQSKFSPIEDNNIHFHAVVSNESGIPTKFYDFFSPNKSYQVVYIPSTPVNVFRQSSFEFLDLIHSKQSNLPYMVTYSCVITDEDLHSSYL